MIEDYIMEVVHLFENFKFNEQIVVEKYSIYSVEIIESHTELTKNRYKLKRSQQVQYYQD